MYRIPFERVNWTTSIFLIATALISVTAVPYFIWKCGIDGFQIGLFFFYIIATMSSITVGYHRLFSHLSFKAAWPVRLFTLVFGACAFENACLDWASDHRRHHKHVDHDGDPYDISKGFMWAHIGWLMFKLNPEPPMDNVADLRKDKLVMWQYRWVHLIGFVAGILVPMGLGWWWNAAHGMNPWIGMLGGFLIPGVARIVVAQHCTFFINSLCHTIGRQPYSSSHSARDSAIMAFLTFGEGYHNYHHEFQHDYRNGVKPWQWDPSKWSIWLLSKVGLTWDLRRVPDGKILLAEMREARKHAEKQLAALEHSAPGLAQRATVAVSDLMEKLTASYHEVEQAVAGKVDLSRRTLRDWQRQTQETVQEISRVLQQVAAQGMSAPSAG